jgi:aminopeptidase N
MLEALTHAIQNHTLSPQDRFNIQTDVYALARAGHIGYIDYLKLLRHAYKYEDNLTVWKSILRQLTELSSILDYAQLNNTKKLYQSYVCDLLSNIYTQLGWEPLPNESSQAPMLRSLILTHTGVHGYDKTRNEAHKRFEQISNKNNHHHLINPNIRAAIYLTVAKTGNQQIFDQIKSVSF